MILMPIIIFRNFTKTQTKLSLILQSNIYRSQTYLLKVLVSVYGIWHYDTSPAIFSALATAHLSIVYRGLGHFLWYLNIKKDQILINYGNGLNKIILSSWFFYINIVLYRKQNDLCNSYFTTAIVIKGIYNKLLPKFII